MTTINNDFWLGQRPDDFWEALSLYLSPSRNGWLWCDMHHVFSSIFLLFQNLWVKKSLHFPMVFEPMAMWPTANATILGSLGLLFLWLWRLVLFLWICILFHLFQKQTLTRWHPSRGLKKVKRRFPNTHIFCCIHWTVEIQVKKW